MSNEFVDAGLIRRRHTDRVLSEDGTDDRCSCPRSEGADRVWIVTQ